MCRFKINPFRQAACRSLAQPDVQALHESLPEYKPTPLVELPALAKELGVGRILVKDESDRFGLKAFKALGATYAIYRLLKERLEREYGVLIRAEDFYRRDDIVESGRFTFCTATDGNHGRGVAWVARKLRQRAVIFMPGNTVAARIESIRSEGADVRVIDGSYDDAVDTAIRESDKNGWQVISDTSWAGYEQIPLWIQSGYLTLFREIEEASCGAPDIVMVPGGVGALAAAASSHYGGSPTEKRSTLVCVEPTDADCLIESISSEKGEPLPGRGGQNSIMAGLNCGTPSPVAWPFIRDRFDLFVTLSDDYCRKAMRRYYHTIGDDPRIVSGESGAATMAGLLTLLGEGSMEEAQECFGLSANTTILVLNTEGDTDPVNYRGIWGA